MPARFLSFAIFADVPEWRNWQTRTPGKCMPETACGFESRFGHALTTIFDSANRRAYHSLTYRVYEVSLG